MSSSEPTPVPLSTGITYMVHSIQHYPQEQNSMHAIFNPWYCSKPKTFACRLQGFPQRSACVTSNRRAGAQAFSTSTSHQCHRDDAVAPRGTDRMLSQNSDRGTTRVAGERDVSETFISLGVLTYRLRCPSQDERARSSPGSSR